MKVAIIGAGISGLTLGYKLLKHHPEMDFDIFEKENRAGGWILTHHEDGFLFEAGPRSFSTQGAGQATLKLIHELGLENQLIKPSPSAKIRYIYYDNQLHALPRTLFEALQMPLTRRALFSLFKEPFKKASILEDETIDSFFKRRFSIEVAEKLIDPLVSGIFAGDPKTLSMRSCFPTLWKYEKEYGSLLKGLLFSKRKAKEFEKEPFLTFKEGMETLPKTLAKILEKHIHFNTRLTTITQNKNILLTFGDGRQKAYDKVYLTLPAHNAAMLFANPLKTLFQSIPSTSVTSINMGWKTNVLKREGFGYLIPSKEQEDILGVVFDSSAFKTQNKLPDETRLTVMLKKELSDDELTFFAKKALKKHLNILEDPSFVKINRARNSIPQYLIHHFKIIENLEKELAQQFVGNVTFLGSSYEGVSVNECIESAITDRKSRKIYKNV